MGHKVVLLLFSIKMNGCPVAAHEEQSVGNHTQFKKPKKKQPSAIRSPQKTTLLKSSYKIFFSIINKSTFSQTISMGKVINTA